MEKTEIVGESRKDNSNYEYVGGDGTDLERPTQRKS